jgi:hypothetical protein
MACLREAASAKAGGGFTLLNMTYLKWMILDLCYSTHGT